MDYPEEMVAQQTTEGKTLVFVLEEDEPAGAVALADIIREKFRSAVEVLQRMGLQVMSVK